MEAVLGLLAVKALLATGAAALVAVAARFFRRPQLVHALWLLVLLELIAPPVVRIGTIPRPFPELASEHPPLAVGAQPSGVVPQDFPQVRPQRPDAGRATVISEAGPEGLAGDTGGVSSWSVPQRLLALSPPWLMVGWLTGFAAVLAAAWGRQRRFNRLQEAVTEGDREAPLPDATERLQERAARLAERLRLRRCPPVRLVDAPVTPMIRLHRWRLELLFPCCLVRRLEPEGIETLLAHELAHVARRDHLVRFVELAASAAFWWHPVSWWARHRLRREEEKACDAMVVEALPGSGPAYARAVLATVESLSPPARTAPALACGLGQFENLRERLTMILDEERPKSREHRHRWIAAALAGCLLLVVPTWAERTSTGSSAPARSSVPADSSAPAGFSEADMPAGTSPGNDVRSEAERAAPASTDARDAERARELARLEAETAALERRLEALRARHAALTARREGLEASADGVRSAQADIERELAATRRELEAERLEPEEVKREIEKALAAIPEELRRELEAEQRLEPEEVKREIEKALAAIPEELRRELAAAQLENSSLNSDEARREIEKALAAVPDDLRRALEAVKSVKPEEVRREIERALEALPDGLRQQLETAQRVAPDEAKREIERALAAYESARQAIPQTSYRQIEKALADAPDQLRKALEEYQRVAPEEIQRQIEKALEGVPEALRQEETARQLALAGEYDRLRRQASGEMTDAQIEALQELQRELAREGDLPGGAGNGDLRRLKREIERLQRELDRQDLQEY